MSNEYINSELKADWENPFKWSSTYHFLFLDEAKHIQNYSENEVIFELEIKNHNKVK